MKISIYPLRSPEPACGRPAPFVSDQRLYTHEWRIILGCNLLGSGKATSYDEARTNATQCRDRIRSAIYGSL